MSLKKIYNIEALRKKIGCETYEELETIYGYDVSGYFNDRKGILQKTHINGKDSFVDDYDDYDDGFYLNLSDPSRSDYMGT